MATPAPDSDNESSPNPPPFITPPLHTLAVTLLKSLSVKSLIAQSNELSYPSGVDNSNYIHHHDADTIRETTQRQKPMMIL